MTKKELLRSVAFSLLVCLLCLVLCELFESRNNSNYDKRFTSFRNLREDTIDAVYIGTSAVDRYWIPAKALEEYGMTVYPLSSDGMPAWLFVDMVKEAFTYQSPEVLIFDMRAFTQSNTAVSTVDARARRVIDAMDFFSVNRFAVALKTTNLVHSINSDWDISYLVPFVKMHSMWSEDDYSIKIHWGSNEHAYGGYFMGSEIVKQVVQTPVVYDAEHFEDLDSVSEAALYELLEYIETNNLQALFVETPNFRNEKTAGRINRVYEILANANADFVTYCLPEECYPVNDHTITIDLDPETDFYNDGHTNYYGAEKFTAAFAAYLDEHYDLADRRTDKAVMTDWEGLYEKIQKRVEKYEK